MAFRLNAVCPGRHSVLFAVLPVGDAPPASALLAPLPLDPRHVRHVHVAAAPSHIQGLQEDGTDAQVLLRPSLLNRLENIFDFFSSVMYELLSKCFNVFV